MRSNDTLNQPFIHPPALLPFIHLLAEAGPIATRKCIKAIMPAAKLEAWGDYGPLTVFMIPAVSAVLNLENEKLHPTKKKRVPDACSFDSKLSGLLTPIRQIQQDPISTRDRVNIIFIRAGVLVFYI